MLLKSVCILLVAGVYSDGPLDDFQWTQNTSVSPKTWSVHVNALLASRYKITENINVHTNMFTFLLDYSCRKSKPEIYFKHHKSKINKDNSNSYTIVSRYECRPEHVENLTSLLFDLRPEFTTNLPLMPYTETVFYEPYHTLLTWQIFLHPSLRVKMTLTELVLFLAFSVTTCRDQLIIAPMPPDCDLRWGM